MRSTSEAIVFGSLAMLLVSPLCVKPSPSCSSKVRMAVNWSGVTPVWAIRRRKAWFNPYHARRRRMGSRRRSGASTGNLFAFAEVLGTIV